MNELIPKGKPMGFNSSTYIDANNILPLESELRGAYNFKLIVTVVSF